MTGIEKRNMVVKEVITPVLKQAGFKKSGLSWWLEFETYIVPELLKVHCLDDWNKLKAARMKRREEKKKKYACCFILARHIRCHARQVTGRF